MAAAAGQHCVGGGRGHDEAEQKDGHLELHGFISALGTISFDILEPCFVLFRVENVT